MHKKPEKRVQWWPQPNNSGKIKLDEMKQKRQFPVFDNMGIIGIENIKQ